MANGMTPATREALKQADAAIRREARVKVKREREMALLMQGITSGAVGFGWAYVPKRKWWGIDSDLVATTAAVLGVVYGPKDTQGTSMTVASTVFALWANGKGEALKAQM